MHDCPLKDWIDVLSALLTPTIAIFGSLMACQQWRVNRSRLKHELFDRRYKQFEATRDFLGSIMTRGVVLQEEELKWIQATRGSAFIFDDSIAAYIEELFKKSADLQAMTAVNDFNRQREIKDWFQDAWANLERRFSPYLRLRH